MKRAKCWLSLFEMRTELLAYFLKLNFLLHKCIPRDLFIYFYCYFCKEGVI
jgi:hypothetical protein